ncbi:MAG: ATP-binding protein [Kouleothrix sp.]|nr:ATP-binding protein [Kouleothrix sp.]
MTIATTSKTVNIRPEVNVLSVFPHLNYKPWYALAEFVDNAVQSFLSYHKELRVAEGDNCKLFVDIEIKTMDTGSIIIRDNAAGIHDEDYARAFKTASLPLDRSGLSEFGVGMKSAACWFARTWSVRTSALGEDVERTITFDVESIIQDAVEELPCAESPASYHSHYTEVVLRDLHTVPQTKTIAKIKDHIASIYRIFLREGTIAIKFNGDFLTYAPPAILNTPFYKDESETPISWHKEISLDFGQGLRVHGFAALRETASTSGAGFALFRRNRLIQGSGDEGYRPEKIFKKSNSYTYQRLFGELHVEGFQVSHTKDGIQWEEHEEIFLDFLKEALNEQPVPLLDQSTGYRVRAKTGDLQKGAKEALDSTAKVIEEEVPPVIEQQLSSKPIPTPTPIKLPNAVMASERIIKLELDGSHWKITVQLSNDLAVGEWLSISDEVPLQKDDHNKIVRQLEIRLNLAHPFMVRFAGPDPDQIEPLLRVAVALALAEVTAREGGLKKAGTIRNGVNEFLREALSKA